MRAPEATLSNIRQTVVKKTTEYRVSDFISREEATELKMDNLRKAKKRVFDGVDAYAAEILARFGYSTYMAWRAGEIPEKNMLRFISAERARDARNRLALERIIILAVSGANNAGKNGRMPRSLAKAIKAFEEEVKTAKGQA